MKGRGLFLFSFLLCLGGCVRLDRPAPERNTFVLDVARPAVEQGGEGRLQVRRLEVFSRFSGTGFVYRLGELNYAADFYNRFLSLPGTLLAEEARQWLAAAGLFESVVSQGPADYLLEGEVSALYGDFREKPQAVLEIRFTLLEAGGARPRILIQQTYRQAVPMAVNSPEFLVNGWNEGLADILTSLEGDLRKLSLTGTPRVGG